jgi:type IV secretory pathway VirB10-like protein
MSREELLKIVPVFVAVLVWLTRILFIGAVTVAGERLMDFHTVQNRAGSQPTPSRQPVRSQAVKPTPAATTSRPAGPRKVSGSSPAPSRPEPVDLAAPPPARSNPSTSNRVRQRPPRPGAPSNGRPQPGSIRASNRR